MADREEWREMRVVRELDRVESARSLIGVNFQRDLNDIRHFTVTLDGPVSSPYEGGIFKIDFLLPETYPLAPPHVRFITKIWHPNISHQSGAIRMSILNNDWSPTMGIKAIVIALQALLSDPDLSDPLDEYVTSHYRAAPESFNRNARYYTEKYAMERDPPPQLTTRTSGTRRLARIPKRLDEFLL